MTSNLVELGKIEKSRRRQSQARGSIATVLFHHHLLNSDLEEGNGRIRRHSSRRHSADMRFSRAVPAVINSAALARDRKRTTSEGW